MDREIDTILREIHYPLVQARRYEADETPSFAKWNRGTAHSLWRTLFLVAGGKPVEVGPALEAWYASRMAGERAGE